jgi:hypothetical protein
MDVAVIGLSLGSACATAASTVLKQRTATRTPPVRGAGAAGLLRLIVATLSQPLWAAALAADFLGVGLQVVALHYGALALVQPLLVTGLLFALLLGHVGRKPPSVREIGWALAVGGSLVGFLRVSGALDTAPRVHVHPIHATIFASCLVLAVVILVVGGQRDVPPAGRAGMLGLAVGAIYAVTASLIKAATGVFADHGALALLLGWQLWAGLAVGTVGLILGQITFQAGPLTASLPAISAVDPLLSVLIGVVVYDEHLHRGPGHGLLMLGLVAVLVVAIIGLSRIESTGRTESETAPDRFTSRCAPAREPQPSARSGSRGASPP